jgi:hypothetical protein
MTQKLDRVIAGYIKLRDRKNELVKKHKEELEPITKQLEFIENYLQKYLLDANLQSVNSDAGTAYLQTVSSATVRDWTASLDFIRTQNEWSFLDARVNKTAVKDYIDAHGVIPPGVEYTEALVTRVRR